MENSYKPPLCINFIWHPHDSAIVEPILKELRGLIARKPERPFSRGLNIPLFYYSSSNPNIAPDNAPIELAEKNLIFCFLGKNTLTWDNWYEYIENSNWDSFHLIPIAIDSYSFNHFQNSSHTINHLRLYEWSEEQVKTAILHIAHEIFRYIAPNFSRDKLGIETSITLFLSHSKTDDTATKQAKSIKDYISYTNLKSFFDASTISPGFNFESEICDCIKNATLIAIKSDSYSSRYWCQREILHAKKCKRPILAVDSRTDYEDRIFPAASNIPCIHVEHQDELSTTDILRVLIASLLETIRVIYIEQLLRFYKRKDWIDNDCQIFIRPPEVEQIFEEKGKNKICYPEPPMYPEEAEWLKRLGISAFTPLWNATENEALKGKKIGISISDTGNNNFSSFHLHSNHTQRLSQDMARYILARAGTVIYGGDLRPSGFTEFIFDEAAALHSRLKSDNINVENYLAWPIHLANDELMEWKSKYKHIVKIISCDPPVDIADNIDRTVYLAPITIENKYIWSRCLTKMREDSIENSYARICAAGKLSEYKGKMPGVLEEIILAIKLAKPLYLLGGFGGVVSEVCKTINFGRLTEPLTETWQRNHNAGYSDLQGYAEQKKHYADYTEIEGILTTLSIKELANRAGLDECEYKRLMESVFTDECVYLVLKGLKNIH